MPNNFTLWLEKYIMQTKNIRTPHLPSGIEDFAEMRDSLGESKLAIADKTRFLPSLLDPTGNKVTVFTRPIRFMKSSTLSMLGHFLSIKDAKKNKLLFDDLAINNEEYADFRNKHQGQYPVIHLNLKNINASNWEDAQEEFGIVMEDLYRRHSYVLSSLNESQQNKYQDILHERSSNIGLKNSLSNLATYLAIHHKKKVIILVDEYDTPLHQAHLHTEKEERKNKDSYFNTMANFLGVFLSRALKGHPDVARGFMTGVLHTAFASLVSSLNNAAVYSVLSPEFAELFGFTEDEIEFFINQIEGVSAEERNHIRSLLQSWYNGYYIGGSKVRVYNPWSVAQFFNRLPYSVDRSAEPYWLQVGDCLSLGEYLYPRFDRIQEQINDLISGKTIQVNIDKRTELFNLDDNDDDSAFWGLLLHAGYLSASRVKTGVTNALTISDVSIPNYEVAGAYAHLIYRYQKNYLLMGKGLRLDNYTDMLKSLINGNIEKFAKHLKVYLEQIMSYHDIPKKEPKPAEKIREQVYHSFIAGMLSSLHIDNFRLISNGEAGYGRYDLVFLPYDIQYSGLIFEFKAVSNPKHLESEAKKALAQIKEKGYGSTLEAGGVSSGLYIGLSFYGKRFSIAYEKVKYPKYSSEQLAEMI